MEDMNDVRRNMGTVADFSNWNGIKAEGSFKHMKLSSKERVIDEEENDIPEESIEEFVKPEIKVDEPKVKNDNEKQETKEPLKKNIREVPAANEAIINPTELKSIAVRLLPSVDKVLSGEKYAEYCEKAIDMAFTFLKVWDLKVSIGG